MNKAVSPLILLTSSLLIYAGFALYPKQPEMERSPLLLLLPILFGVLCVFAAQWLARNQTMEKLSWLVQASRWLRVQPYQTIPLLLGALLVGISPLAAGDQPLMRAPLLAIVTWGLATCFVIAGGWRGEMRHPDRKTWLSLGVIFGLALALRLVFYDSIPSALTGDEGSSGMAASNFATGLNNNLFRSDWFSFPAFYFSIPGLLIRFLGQNLLALRLSSAIPGALTVVAVFCIARAAFGTRAAWFGAIILAFLHYHIHFSRISLNNIWDGLWITITVGALWYGWEHERRNAFLLAGLSLGLSQYFYTSGRVFLLIGLAWLVIVGIFQRQKLLRLLPDLLLMAFVVLVVFWPIGLFYTQHPEEMLAPLNRVTLVGNGWIENQTSLRGLPAWRIWLEQFGMGLGAYSWQNLRAWYMPDMPILRPETAAFALLGLLFSITNKTGRSLNILIILWLLAFAAIGALSESTPAAQRYVASAPALALLAGCGIHEFFKRLGEPWPRLQKAAHILAVLTIMVMAARETHFYFVEYQARYKQNSAHENTQIGHRLGIYLRDHPRPDFLVIFMGWPNMGFQSIPSTQYFAPHARGVDINVPWGSPEIPEFHEPGLRFVILPHLPEDLAKVQTQFPNGKLHTEMANDGAPLFYIYECANRK